MKKMLFAFLILGISLSLTGCISEEEKETAEKYKLKYVYIEEQIELKEEDYSKIFNFIARSSTDKLVFDLHYLNFPPLFVQNDEEKIPIIQKSLIGFSLKVYDENNKQLIHSYEIAENKPLFFNTATPSLELGGTAKIKGKRKYEVKLEIPAKRDTPIEYLKPTFVVGILQEPSL